jgi:sugar transferase EpsL
MKQEGLRLWIKRGVDVTLAGAAGLLGAPLIAATALAVRYAIGRPVLFSQQRPGRHGAPFRLYKFRTMTDARDAEGNLLPDRQRLTRIGKLLRDFSLDELPQLWNVVNGDMSLVGPRPLLTQYLDRYTPEQARRHDVLPGITGWAQVNGRNSRSWEEKFELDVWYVDHWSPMLDAKILAVTILAVLRRDGVAHAGYTTMPEFLGYDGTAVPAPEYRDAPEPSDVSTR